jgi:hypothetical protein
MGQIFSSGAESSSRDQISFTNVRNRKINICVHRYNHIEPLYPAQLFLWFVLVLSFYSGLSFTSGFLPFTFHQRRNCMRFLDPPIFYIRHPPHFLHIFILVLLHGDLWSSSSYTFPRLPVTCWISETIVCRLTLNGCTRKLWLRLSF